MTNGAGTPETGTLLIEEFETRELPLAARAVTMLQARYAAQIAITPTERPGTYRVAARQHVGRLSLPGGGMLVIRPKVGVSNLFYMLAAAPGPAHFAPPPTSLTPDAEIFSFVLAVLVQQVEDLLRGGLLQGYVMHEDDLPFVRGQIRLGAQVRLHGDLKDRHVCSYAAFTPDTSENRVLAATLRVLPALLQPVGEAALVRRVRTLLRYFADVTPISRGMAVALLPRISIHRLNAAYGPVLGLCRLALHHLSLAEHPGSQPFASFLVDMPRLFECFLTARLRAGLATTGLRVVAQHHDFLDESRQVSIRPDILVYAVAGTLPLLVIDAKYRRIGPNGEGELSQDLYQVNAYLDRYGLRRGVLIYPQFEGMAQVELRLRGTPKRIHLATLNLSCPDLPTFEHEIRLLTEQVAKLAHAPA